MSEKVAKTVKVPDPSAARTHSIPPHGVRTMPTLHQPAADVAQYDGSHLSPEARAALVKVGGEQAAHIRAVADRK